MLDTELFVAFITFEFHREGVLASRFLTLAVVTLSFEFTSFIHFDSQTSLATAIDVLRHCKVIIFVCSDHNCFLTDGTDRQPPAITSLTAMIIRVCGTKLPVTEMASHWEKVKLPTMFCLTTLPTVTL